MEGWLARVATRIAIDVLRRKPARRRREEAHSALRPETESPDREVLRREEAVLLGRCLDELSIETRAAVWLHVVEGQSIRDVAACLGSTRSTVNRRIQAGLERLRAGLSRASLGLAPAMSVEDLLRRLPPAEPPGDLLARLVGLAAGRPDGLGGTGSLAAGPGWSTATRRGIRTGAVPLLIGLGALITYRLLVPTGDPGNGAPGPGPVARIDPGAVELEKEAGKALPETPPVEGVDAARVQVEEGTIRIAGRVLDRAGAPSAGADVHIHDDLAQRDIHEMLDAWSFLEILQAVLEGPRPIASGKTDGEGRFELHAPAAKDTLVHAVSADGQDSGAIHLAAEGTGVEVVVAMVPALAVKGRVLSEAERIPLGGARVALVPDPTPPLDRDLTSHDVQALLDAFVPAWSDADPAGHFTLPPVPLSPVLSYRVIARREGYAAAHAIVPEEPGEVDVLLRTRTFVSGQTVASPGEIPVSGVRLLALGGDMPTEQTEAARGWFAIGLSGARGEFLLDGAPDGKWFLFAKERGRLAPARVDLGSSGDLPVRVVLGGESAIHGTVRFAESGEPARGIRVLCRGMEGAYSTSETITDALGAYRFGGLPGERSYELIVVLPGFVPRDHLPRTRGDGVVSERHDIDLIPTAAIRGTVRGPDGEPVAGARVEVFATTDDLAEGVRLRWRAEVLEKSGFTTDAEGGFRADDVPSGGKIYAWAYHPELGEALTGPVSLSGDPPSGTLDLKLDGAGLEVAARTSEGSPLEGIFVNLESQTVWGWLPDGYNLGQWYARLTSLDISRHRRELSLIPGSRRALTGSDGTCRWTDLSASSYQLALHLQLKEGRLSNWEQEYWLWMGATEPLHPKEVRRLEFVVESRRQVEGKVVSRSGPLPRLRVQVWFRGALPGLKNVYGYSVTHTRDDGSFRAEGVGAGPYDIWINEHEFPMLKVMDVPEGDEVSITYSRPEKEG